MDDQDLSVLNEQQRTVYILRTEQSMSFEEIGRRIGVSGSRARQCLGEAERRLREYAGYQEAIAGTKRDINFALSQAEIRELREAMFSHRSNMENSIKSLKGYYRGQGERRIQIIANLSERIHKLERSLIGLDQPEGKEGSDTGL